MVPETHNSTKGKRELLKQYSLHHDEFLTEPIPSKFSQSLSELGTEIEVGERKIQVSEGGCPSTDR